jgi:16S rRNA (guanine966-N2)-methyltransferase
MNKVRIIAGDYRGKIIHFSNKKFDDADITPQKVKGALFSSIGEKLSGTSFLDLYGASGQIGFEALSRGADRVIINEQDKKRFSFIQAFAAELMTSPRLVLLNLNAASAIGYVKKAGYMLDYVFIDPPYHKTGGTPMHYDTIITLIGESGVVRDNGLIIVQHFSANVMPRKISSCQCQSTKKYGNTSLSFYKI